MRKRVKAVPCEVYSRVVGYFRPVRNWNRGKRQEFEERKTVKVSTLEEVFGSREEGGDEFVQPADSVGIILNERGR